MLFCTRYTNVKLRLQRLSTPIKNKILLHPDTMRYDTIALYYTAR